MTGGAASGRRSAPNSPRLVAAKHLREYRIEVRFDDGKGGVIDLEGELWGEVFEPLKDLALFRRFRFDEELETIVWPTGADLAPEFLYERAVSADDSPAGGARGDSGE